MRKTGPSTRRRRRGPKHKLTPVQRKFVRDCYREDRRQRPHAKLARRGLVKRLATVFGVDRKTIIHVMHPRKKRRKMSGKLPMAQRTHCPHGHEYTPENTRVLVQGTRRDGSPVKKRQCLICKKEWRGKKIARDKARQQAAPTEASI